MSKILRPFNIACFTTSVTFILYEEYVTAAAPTMMYLHTHANKLMLTRNAKDATERNCYFPSGNRLALTLDHSQYGN